MTERRFRRGLVVGKFAPLHHGHELVIRRALNSCDHVVLLSYSRPELEGCEPARRERWLDALFPQTRRLVVTGERLADWGVQRDACPEVPPNNAPAQVHRVFCARLCKHVLGCAVDAVFTSEPYGQSFAAELTRQFRSWNRTLAPVTHVSVDEDRRAFPISGTSIRADVHAHRKWLSPQVYASFIQRVCVLGGESSGKTTLSQELARVHRTTFVAEYGRQLWEQRAGLLEFADLLRIAQVQVAREEAALAEAFRYLFCDTSPLTTLFYSEAMFGRVDEELVRLATRSYDLYVLCDTDFGFEQDGTRQGESFTARQQAWYERELGKRRIAYVRARGTLAERLAAVGRALGL